jgi:hypothetical protein
VQLREPLRAAVDRDPALGRRELLAELEEEVPDEVALCGACAGAAGQRAPALAV